MALYEDIQAIYADEVLSEDQKRRARWQLVNPALKNAIEGLTLPATVTLETQRGLVIHKVKIDTDEKTLKFHVEFIRNGAVVVFTLPDGRAYTRRLVRLRKPPILVPHPGGSIIIGDVKYREDLVEAFRQVAIQIHRRLVP